MSDLAVRPNAAPASASYSEILSTPLAVVSLFCLLGLAIKRGASPAVCLGRDQLGDLPPGMSRRDRAALAAMLTAAARRPLHPFNRAAPASADVLNPTPLRADASAATPQVP
jgi:hypothetical protein